MSQPPRLFDRALHRRRLARAASDFGAADFLKRRAADDVVVRLEAVQRRFEVAVDLGARDGAFARALAPSDAAAKVGLLIETDLSAAMLAGRGGPRLVADEERLPFAEASLDLVVSSLALHWTNDLVGALIQIRRALKPDGLFIGALLGGATLSELRQALLQAEAEVRGGAGPRVSPFADAYDGAALLQRAGFALPVADVDKVAVRYAHPLKLLADLRAMGETSVLTERPPLPLNRAILERAVAIYAERFSGPDGRVNATFEILTLTGWAPHPDQQQPLKPGSAKMRLADALGVVEHKAGDRAGRGKPA
jgi:SAM-dependent methyltransferase